MAQIVTSPVASHFTTFLANLSSALSIAAATVTLALPAGQAQAPEPAPPPSSTIVQVFQQCGVPLELPTGQRVPEQPIGAGQPSR